MNNVRQELEQFRTTWNNAEVKDAGEYTPLPDGKYQSRIEEVRFENAKTSGRLQLAWVLKIVAPEALEGKTIYHYRGLDRDESVSWMAQELYTCGVDVKGIDIVDLPDHLPQLLDRIIEVMLKTKKNANGEFQNCYINRLLNEGNEQAEYSSIPF